MHKLQVTNYLKDDSKFGKFWQRLYQEHRLAENYLLEISGQDQLLDRSPRARASITLRENAVLPLLVIQQYALMKVRELRDQKADSEDYKTFEKLIIRTLYGNINAARNSA